MQRTTDPFRWVHCSFLNSEAEPALSSSGSSSLCCRETQTSFGNEASTLGLGDLSLVLRHDPRLRLNFGEVITPAGFPFKRLYSSCWPADWRSTNDAACEIQPQKGSSENICAFFTSWWWFSRVAPTNLSGGRAVQIIDFLVSLKR